MDKLTHRNTRALFLGPQPPEPEFLPEEEQEQLIQALRISNQQANDLFKTILQALSILEILTHLAFTTYTWYRRTFSHTSPFPDHEDPLDAFRHNASPLTATLFSLVSFVMGILLIKDTSRIARDSLIVWTFVSTTPLLLMIGATEFSFELLWWSMPLLLQIVDLASLWVMKDPDESFIELEKSQYKLKSA